MAEQVGSIYYDASIDTANFKRDAQTIERTAGLSAEKIGKSLDSAGKKMTTFVTLPILAVGGMSMKMAMELEATEAKYNTVFGDMSKTADQFVKDFQKLTPATKASARSMASGIQDLLVPMGFMRQEATDLTGKTMHLIGALTNFNSATHTAEDVSLALSSALTGETQSLKRLGIQINQETLLKKAMIMTGKENAKEITNQDKALALLELSYEQSTDALAAYNEASLDAKTKLALATNGMKDMAGEIMYQFLPVIDKISSKVRDFTEWIKNLTPEQKDMAIKTVAVVAALGPLLIVVGKIVAFLPKLIAGIKVLGPILASLASGPVGLVILALVALAGIFIWLEKKFKVFSSLWEEIRVKIEPFVAIFNKEVLPVLKKVADFIKGVFIESLQRLKKAWENLQPIIEKLMPSLKLLGGALLIAVVIPLAAVAAAIVTVITVITSVVTAIAWAAGMMAEYISWIANKFEERWQEIKNGWESVKEMFNGVGSFFRGIWNTIKNIFTDIGTSIGTALGNAFKSVVNSVLRNAINTINGFIDSINNAIKIINKMPGVKIGSIGRVAIPQLAEGGVITRPTLAMVGEGKEAEAVMPLSKLENMISGGQTTINISMSGVMTSSPSDERAIARRLVERLNEELRSKGKVELAI